jgi:hypothetical protein
MNIAQQIVTALLENGAVQTCAACQKEFGVASQPGESHGYCKRHLMDMWGQFPPGHAKAAQMIRDIPGRPDSEFPPDLAQQRQAAPARM